MVPEHGDYQALAWRDNAQVLVRSADGIELLSNICRHRQAIMLDRPRQQAEHRLPDSSLDLRHRGPAAGAPHFAEQPCVKLRSTPLQNWHGLLFDGPRDIAADLADVGAAQDSIFRDTFSIASKSTSAPTTGRPSSKSISRTTTSVRFIRVSGSLSPATTCAWKFGDRYSLQTVGVNNGLAKPGTKTYERWHQAVLAYYEASLRRTARSGSRSIRTSCSSGMHTCSWSAR